MTFSQRLEELCKAKNITGAELERALGFSKGNVTKWKKFNPSQKALVKLANYFNVSIDYLTGTSDKIINEDTIKLQKEIDAHQGITKTTAIQIPVFKRIKNSLDIECGSDIEYYIEVPEELTYSGQYFGLKVNNNDLSPRIEEGDTLIIKKQNHANTGDIVLIESKQTDKDAEIKRLLAYSKKFMTLGSTKLNDKPIEISKDTVEIIGKVVENRQNYD